MLIRHGIHGISSHALISNTGVVGSRYESFSTPRYSLSISLIVVLVNRVRFCDNLGIPGHDSPYRLGGGFEQVWNLR